MVFFMCEVFSSAQHEWLKSTKTLAAVHPYINERNKFRMAAGWPIISLPNQGFGTNNKYIFRCSLEVTALASPNVVFARWPIHTQSRFPISNAL